VDADSAARRWAATWERAWPARDADSIVALYAADAAYRSVAFREPDRGLAGVRGYLARNFDAESGIECRFGEPLTSGDRAAVQWWASWAEDGQALTLAGVTILRFAPDGLVVDHRDYWNQLDQREPPYAGW
jgi:nuclear transport factor 2 (NTF2) superfamily protein